MTSNIVHCNAMLSKSRGSYASAIDDFDKQRYDRCVSSLYYSAFQTVVALMILRKENASTHTYVRSFVNKELVFSGFLTKELGSVYNKLMDMRSDADYKPLVSFNLEITARLKEQVKAFNERIIEIIKTESTTN